VNSPQRLSCCAVALFVGALCAQTAKVDKPYATPEEAVARMESTAKAGDVEGFLATLHPAARKVMREVLAVAASRKAFEGAVDAKFGPDPEVKVRRDFDAKKELERIVSITVVSRKAVDKPKTPEKTEKTEKTEKVEEVPERVELRLKTVRREASGTGTKSEEESFTAVKEGEGWTLLLPRMSDVKELDKRAEGYAKTRVGMDLLARDVRDGKFKDREDVRAALTKVLTGAK